MVNQIKKYAGKPSLGLAGILGRGIKAETIAKYNAFKKKIDNPMPSKDKLKTNGKLKKRYTHKWYWK